MIDQTELLRRIISDAVADLLRDLTIQEHITPHGAGDAVAAEVVRKMRAASVQAVSDV